MTSIAAVTARCHCGAVSIGIAAVPAEVTHCNCSLCRSYGVLWFYTDAAALTGVPDAAATDRYAWNGRHVDFHRCRTCGCVTHWIPRDGAREDRGVNARLLPPEVLAAARVRHRNGAGDGAYLD